MLRISEIGPFRLPWRCLQAGRYPVPFYGRGYIEVAGTTRTAVSGRAAPRPQGPRDIQSVTHQPDDAAGAQVATRAVRGSQAVNSATGTACLTLKAVLQHSDLCNTLWV
jgi:hypothetical protein